ncbi:putative Mitochondrial calcium uniporter [Trypanosoma vivax]|uniref:Calcium uniporter protein C-terminal domain-containing protein n=1 Tax=Trypanosoma vivax (strain Y486) TaxID=1055687 RepID=G0U522_TRYVY|nr:putative Mitochondrial calcium uniporter [Trypanosoma vivax]CCC50970.1 conserved hypothetical protein [Trypanosoma vivax Y486]
MRRTALFCCGTTELQLLRKKTWARCALDCNYKKVLKTNEFLTLCQSNPYAPPSERMTADEAGKFLKALHAARQVVIVGDHVYTDPSDVVNAVHLRLQLPTLVRATSVAEGRAAAVSHGPRMTPPDDNTHRRSFWAVACLLSGAQMTILSYLTFVVYDWSVMEPVCYFVSSISSLCAMTYSAMCRRGYPNEAAGAQLTGHGARAAEALTSFGGLTNPCRVAGLPCEDDLDDAMSLLDAAELLSNPGTNNDCGECIVPPVLASSGAK